MPDPDKTKEELIDELEELRQRNAELEATLRNRDERYPNAIAQADSVAYEDDWVNRTYIFMDEGIKHLTGYTADEITPDIFGSLIEENIQYVTKSMKLRSEVSRRVGGEASTLYRADYHIRTRDGRMVWVADSAVQIRDDSGKLIGSLGMLQDISYRKQAEEALRDSERRNRALLEAIPDLIFRLSGDGIFLDFVPSKDIDTYIPPDDFLGKRVDEVFPREETQQVMNSMRQALQTGQMQVYEYQLPIRSAGAQIREYEARYVASGKDEVFAIVRDITERKRMEEELLKIQKLESIGVLAGGIAHDLNNLLTAVVGNISLARMYKDLAEKDKRLAEAEAASMQIKDLTQQLLTFSKGGAPILQMSAIAELLESSATFALSGSNVKCEFSISDDLWTVEADEGQINQVIHNLIINADQAIPEGGLVRICAENINVDTESGLPLKAGEYIKISIEDQGLGIPKEHLNRIFDPFFTTKQAGNGLGLATSYSIIQNHNGYITVDSQLGVGTTFHIYLPALSEAVMMERETTKNIPIKGSGRILVMDDEKHVRDLAAEILSRLGYEVTTSIDGSETIELYRDAMTSEEPFNAVILDLTVPGSMGGREAIQELIEIDPEIKAIVSSGYSNDPVMAYFREYGFRGVIAKPYRALELSAVLYRVMME